MASSIILLPIGGFRKMHGHALKKENIQEDAPQPEVYFNNLLLYNTYAKIRRHT